MIFESFFIISGKSFSLSFSEKPEHKTLRTPQICTLQMHTRQTGGLPRSTDPTGQPELRRLAVDRVDLAAGEPNGEGARGGAEGARGGRREAEQ
jgi:hypothetical protein